MPWLVGVEARVLHYRRHRGAGPDRVLGSLELKPGYCTASAGLAGCQGPSSVIGTTLTPSSRV